MLLPQPREIEWTGSYLTLPTNFPIIHPQTDEVLHQAARHLQEIIFKNHRLAPSISSTTAPSSDIPGVQLIRTTLGAKNYDEAYELEVAHDGVTIRAATLAGLINAGRTLVQLFPLEETGFAVLPTVNITDEPTFSWRGMHLDVARHFFTVAEVEDYIDLLALHKFNTFHWHLVDDQGWRIESRRYPLLTEIGAWRFREGGTTYGGYYTQDEIRRVVAYAAQRQIEVVPEIEMPGHCLAALAAYPELSCQGGPFDVPEKWQVFYDLFCPGNPETITFLKEILAEVCSLFPGRYIHLGGDNCPRDRWQDCPRCQALVQAEGLTEVDQLQGWLLTKLAGEVNGLGKKPLGWDEIMTGSPPPPGTTVMAWRDQEKGLAAAAAGYDVVMTPLSHCYFDFAQAQHGETGAGNRILTLEQVYSFNPVPPGVDSTLAKHILGGQGNVWTELIPDRESLQHMAIPRICALAETLWTARANRDFSEFRERLAPHLKRLEKSGYNHRNSFQDD